MEWVGENIGRGNGFAERANVTSLLGLEEAAKFERRRTQEWSGRLAGSGRGSSWRDVLRVLSELGEVASGLVRFARQGQRLFGTRRAERRHGGGGESRRPVTRELNLKPRRANEDT